MTDIILRTSNALPVPLPPPSPKEEITTRLANDADIPWIDSLQKKYSKNLGFMPKMWLEGKIKAKQILVAEVIESRSDDIAGVLLSAHSNRLTRVGYIIAQDRYMKRDELGIVYQLVVAPGKQRSFIGAALLKAQFDRSQYGCRLYCCWCAQDLEANHFWEAMGFYPLAFRNGAEKKGKDGKHRVHIFWEKKIRGRDDTVNWWFPAKTEGGAMGADRLALPIPPGVHWSEVEPIEIPVIGGEKLLEAPKEHQARVVKPKVVMTKSVKPSRMMFGPVEVAKVEEVTVEKEKVKKPKSTRAKIDPVFIAKSKELRDRYLEQVNEKGFRLESAGKYELCRGIGEATSPKEIKRLAV